MQQVGEACICRLSNVLESLKDLRHLSLAANGLSDLPIGLWKQTGLLSLDLSDNLLITLPEESTELLSLQVTPTSKSLGTAVMQSLGLYHILQSCAICTHPSSLQSRKETASFVHQKVFPRGDTQPEVNAALLFSEQVLDVRGNQKLQSLPQRLTAMNNLKLELPEHLLRRET